MRTSDAKAASYKPHAMATPMISHARVKPTQSDASARPASAKANRTLETSNTDRPPCWSIQRPAQGLSTADSTRDIESSANTLELAKPSSFEMGVASMAGR